MYAASSITVYMYVVYIYMFLFLVRMLFEGVVDTVREPEIVADVTNITRRKGWGKLAEKHSLKKLLKKRNQMCYLFHVSIVFSATHISVVFGLCSHGNAL